MATYTLPTPSGEMPFSWWTRYVLDGSNYWFEFRYNDRDGFWYLAVSGEGRVVQVQGIKLTLGTDKLRQYKHADVPPGSFDVVDTNGTSIEPRIADFGTRVVLRYTDSVVDAPASREKFEYEYATPE